MTTITAASPVPPVAYLDGYIDAHFEDPDVIVTRIDWAREYDLAWADQYAAGTIAAHLARHPVGSRAVTIAPVAPVQPIPAPLPTRNLAVADWVAAEAGMYAGTRPGFLAYDAEWHGHTDATALAHLPGGITLLYEAGAPDVAHDWGRITATVGCGHGVQHESPITSQRDLDHLVALAEDCAGHPDMQETQPINLLRPGTGDLAMERLVAWHKGNGGHRRAA